MTSPQDEQRCQVTVELTLTWAGAYGRVCGNPLPCDDHKEDDDAIDEMREIPGGVGGGDDPCGDSVSAAVSADDHPVACAPCGCGGCRYGGSRRSLAEVHEFSGSCTCW